jgi:hypothetical protein
MAKQHPNDQLTFAWPPAAPVASQSVALRQVALPGIEAATEPAVQPAKPRTQKPRRGPARLPVPRPLPSAVGKGNFGEDERGPVRPNRDEVRAITDQQAERLIDLLDGLTATEGKLRTTTSGDRAALIREKDRLLCAFQSGIGLYAEDFGQIAANRLEAYVRHQLYVRTRAR